ncbi:MAG: DinB family protein [Bacteroidetes bacterium]|nr:hypothetical protein AWN76_016880 [Rhodothermaceae bacterium RA]RMH60775.1 MAG: DinB family protein [Bacteroidota bacterium]
MPDPSTLDVRHPHLQHCLAEVRDALARARALGATYSPAQLAWKPEPSVWNMLECLDHLIVLDGMYVPHIRAAIDGAPEALRGSEAPFKPSLLGRLFYQMVKPDPAFRLKAPRPFTPRPALTDTAVIDRFVAHQETLMDLMRRADGLHLRKVTLPSPLSSLLRFSLGDVFWFLPAHQQRHLRQAERLARHPDFPPA